LGRCQASGEAPHSKGVGFQPPGRSAGLPQVSPVTTPPALRPFWAGFRAMRSDAKDVGMGKASRLHIVRTLMRKNLDAREL
jgi:hypothetical protein